MLEYRYKFPNKKKSKRKINSPWLVADHYDGSNNDVAFHQVDVKIDGTIYTKRSKVFKEAWNKEYMWWKLNR